MLPIASMCCLLFCEMLKVLILYFALGAHAWLEILLKTFGALNKFKLFCRVFILESCVLTHLSTILSLMKYTCKDRLSCTVYVTNEHIVHQLILLIFSV